MLDSPVVVLFCLVVTVILRQGLDAGPLVVDNVARLRSSLNGSQEGQRGPRRGYQLEVHDGRICKEMI